MINGRRQKMKKAEKNNIEKEDQEIQEIMDLAHNGDPAAQRELGCWYYNPVDEMLKEALKWWRRAAKGNDADAQYFLGMEYAYGEGLLGINANVKTARKWLKLAAAQKDLEAIKMLKEMDEAE